MLYLSSKHENFPYEICKELYEVNEKYVQPLGIEFDDLLSGLNGNFWAVISENMLIGCIYFELRGEKLFLSGFSARKTYKYIAKAICGLCELYFKSYDTIYAETPFKWAKSALTRANFKELEKNIYFKERN